MLNRRNLITGSFGGLLGLFVSKKILGDIEPKDTHPESRRPFDVGDKVRFEYLHTETEPSYKEGIIRSIDLSDYYGSLWFKLWEKYYPNWEDIKRVYVIRVRCEPKDRIMVGILENGMSLIEEENNV